MALPAINNLATTLTVSVLIGDTTLHVASTTGWPTSGIVSIEREVISYTGVTSVTFTGCTRGTDGTTAAAHSLTTTAGDAQPVELRIVAGHVTEIHDELDLLAPQYTTYYNSASAVDFLVVPANYRITDIDLLIVVPFNGAGAAIDIGTAGTPDLYVDATVLDLTATAETWFSTRVDAVGPLTIRLTTTPGTTPTAGQALVVLRLAAP